MKLVELRNPPTILHNFLISLSSYRNSCLNSAVCPLNWSVLMSLVTGSLSMIWKSNACRTSTGAGQQPQHRPQRDSGKMQHDCSFVNEALYGLFSTFINQV